MCEKRYFQAARQKLTVRMGMEATRFTPVQRLLTEPDVAVWNADTAEN
jgi:hypothetical protein